MRVGTEAGVWNGEGEAGRGFDSGCTKTHGKPYWKTSSPTGRPRTPSRLPTTSRPQYIRTSMICKLLFKWCTDNKNSNPR